MFLPTHMYFITGASKITVTPARPLDTACPFSSCLTRNHFPSLGSRLRLSQLSSSFLVTHVPVSYFACFTPLPPPYRALASSYFVWAFFPLCCQLALRGCVQTSSLLTPLCSVLNFTVTFQIQHFLPEPSLPWPSVFGPVLDLAASSSYPICCSSSPSPSSSLYKHPLLLAFLLAEMGESGEGSKEVYSRANLTSLQWESGLKSGRRIRILFLAPHPLASPLSPASLPKLN